MNSLRRVLSLLIFLFALFGTASFAQKKSPKSVNEPLFGKALANVKVTGSRLAGTCFYVVSGHGGPDPGAIGKQGNAQLHEDEYAYDVALRLARNLMQEGAQVRIIIQDAKDGIRNDRYLKNSKRETCMGDPIPLNQTARLRQRCAAINSHYYKDKQKYKYLRAIFLHIDSRSMRQQTDVFFYHAKNSTLGQRLAERMKTTFAQKYGRHQPGRGFTGTVSSRNLYVLNQATPVGLFVELGNIRNAFDQRRFVISDNRQALAKWMMEGFIADYKASSSKTKRKSKSKK
jgi:N-acetylmuramoyl-L-alanine amidase